VTVGASTRTRWTVPLVLVPVITAVLFPFAVMLLTSLKPSSEVFATPPDWLPHQWRWQNYRDIWSYVPLGRYFMNSLINAGGATILGLACGLPAAYALARLRFRGRQFFLTMVLITQMFSPIVIIAGLYRTVAALGLADTHISLIVTYAALNLAFTIWLLTGYLGTVPREIEEAALIDGLSLILIS